MVNVIEQLENLIKFKDLASINLKQNGLKFINSLCKEKNFLENIVDLKGKELLENILNFELLKDNDIDGLSNDYILNDFYCLKKTFETQTNPIIIETLKIINKLIKNKFDFKDNKILLTKALTIVRYSYNN